MARKIPSPITKRVASFYDAARRGHRPAGLIKDSIDWQIWQAGVDDCVYRSTGHVIEARRAEILQHYGETLELWKRLGSGISWCHGTFNWWSGCVKTSPGCKHCYAEDLVVNRGGRKVWGRKAPRPRTGRAVWNAFQKFRRLQDDPMWRIEVGLKVGERPRVFVGSIMDIAEARDDEMLAIVEDGFDVVREADDVDWLFLTKRPQNVPAFLPSDWGIGWSHCWWMTSIESGLPGCKDAELGAPVLTRVEHLLNIPARFHGVSYEPAIGPLAEQLRPFMKRRRPMVCGNHRACARPWNWQMSSKVDWVIYGGESGKNFRPEGTAADPQLWARDMKVACKDTETAFFFKQSAAKRNETGTRLDGAEIHEYPSGPMLPAL